jgi:hypothetical protein
MDSRWDWSKMINIGMIEIGIKRQSDFWIMLSVFGIQADEHRKRPRMVAALVVLLSTLLPPVSAFRGVFGAFRTFYLLHTRKART